MLKKVRKLALSPYAVGAYIVTALVAQAQLAGALTITSNVTEDFTAVKSTLTTYIVAGAVMVVTLALIVVGILMVVRWARRAARS